MVLDTVLTKNKQEIDWEEIKTDIEVISNSWNTIILDLYKINAKNEDILSFSNTLDKTIVSIKNENKEESLANLSTLYSHIPVFFETISNKKTEQSIKQTKSYLVNAYSLASIKMEDNNININVDKAIEEFTKVMNDINYSKNKTHKINQAYVEINELKNSLDEKDQDLFFLKYKNSMESINTL